MRRNFLVVLISLAGVTLAGAQQPSPSQPKVKVNMLNVCSPSSDEQQQIASALARVPRQPLFSDDFEVDRGRSSLEAPPNFLQPGAHTEMDPNSDLATWVRIRREFAVQALFATVQYSFSVDAKYMTETMVFHVRDPKELMEISLEDSASSVTPPAAMLGTSTPVTHIKLERFGKPSVVLARCPGSEGSPAPDQSAYEPLFRSATSIVTNYRNILDARQTVPDELARTNGMGIAGAMPTSKLRKPAQPKK